MHDWWCYLVVSALGRVIYDPRPWLRYRQHASNVIGGSASFSKMLLARANRYVTGKRGVLRLSDMAREFERCFGRELHAADRGLLLGLHCRQDILAFAPAHERFAASEADPLRRSPDLVRVDGAQ